MVVLLSNILNSGSLKGELLLREVVQSRSLFRILFQNCGSYSRVSLPVWNLTNTCWSQNGTYLLYHAFVPRADWIGYGRNDFFLPKSGLSWLCQTGIILQNLSYY